MRQRRIKNLDEKLDVYSGGIRVNPKALKGRWKDIFEKDQPVFMELGCGKGQFIRKLAETYPDRNFIAVEGNGSVLLRSLQRLARLRLELPENLSTLGKAGSSALSHSGEAGSPAHSDSAGTAGHAFADPSYTPAVENVVPYGIFAVDAEKLGIDTEKKFDSPWRSAGSDCLFAAGPNLVFANMYLRAVSDCFDRDELSGIYLNFSDPWPKERQAYKRLTHRNYLEGYREVMPSGSCLEFKTDNEQLFRFSIGEFRESGLEQLEYTEDLHGEGKNFLSAGFMTEYEEKFSSKGNPIYYCKVRFTK